MYFLKHILYAYVRGNTTDGGGGENITSGVLYSSTFLCCYSATDHPSHGRQTQCGGVGVECTIKF